MYDLQKRVSGREKRKREMREIYMVITGFSPGKIADRAGGHCWAEFVTTSIILVII